MRPRPRTTLLYNNMCNLLPGGVSSPVRSCKSVGQMPLIVEKGKGATVTDVDGHTYIDYCSSWGASLHGHAHPEIVNAACEQMKKGSSFGISTELEYQLACKIQSHVPSLETLRFVSSGTEATMTAIRVARGYTKKRRILKFSGHYHGHVDALLVQAGSGVAGLNAESSSEGIPQEFVRFTHVLPFNDEKALQKFFEQAEIKEDLAAVILEPIPANMGLVHPQPDFLKLLVQKCRENGALLIMDEVISGFRVGLGGAQKLYGITPDLSCFGKIIGGGFPAAAFGGKRIIMNQLAPVGKVYQAGTLSGNPVAMAAGLKALELAERPGFYDNLEAKVNILTKPIQEWIEKNQANICLNQSGSLFTIFFGKKSVSNFEEALEIDAKTFERFFQTLFQQGIYPPPSPWEAWFVSDAHSEDQLIETKEKILQFLENNL